MKPIRENVMVAAFLRAEIDSPRSGVYVQGWLNAHSGDRKIIDQPNFDDPNENRIRGEVLKGYRGYGANARLFTHFPTDMSWLQGEVLLADLNGLRYADCSPWRNLSGGTLLVADAARRIRDGLATGADVAPIVGHVRSIAAVLDSGARLPEVILVSTSPSAPKIPIEGHTRMTAHLLRASQEAIPAIVGYSANLARWATMRWQ